VCPLSLAIIYAAATVAKLMYWALHTRPKELHPVCSGRNAAV